MLKFNGEQQLREFAETAYPQSVIKITDRIHHVVGYAHSNAIVIEAENSVILVDTFDTDERALRLKALIAEITDKPVKTIIYTHGHPDHRGGAGAFKDTVEEIIAFAPERPLLPRTDMLKDILNQRGNDQFGYELSEEEALTQGIGIREGFTKRDGKRAFLIPNTVYPYREKVELMIDGVRVELVPVMGETEDQILVWLPDDKALCCGDNYYGCFPNLYAIRGGQYRDVGAWIDSLETLLSYEAEYVLPGHTRPLIGKEKAKEVLSRFREAIEYVLEETLRGMNEGRTPEELASTIRLPQHLADLPYLGEFYGTVAWTVRSIYTGYLGWFDGNPTNLNKLPSSEHASKMLKLVGGATHLLEEIRIGLDCEEYQWAIELCDLLLNAQEKTNQALLLKAEGLKALSKQEMSANGRHYYIAYAKRLMNNQT